MPFSTAGKNLLIGALPSTMYAQLHIGDPGAAGTSNQATTTTRQAFTLTAASSGGRSNDANVTWTGITVTGPSETISYLSIWTASSGGTHYANAAVSPGKIVQNGDTLQINTNDLDFVVVDV